MSQSAIYQWINNGAIKPESKSAALVVADEQPNPAEWPVFIRGLLMQLGLLSLLVALLFFTAYNWQAMGDIFKFALLQATLIIVAVTFMLLRLGLFSHRFQLSDYSQKLLEDVLLVVLFFTIGGLLALFGQVYQTGADPWHLFALWSLLVAPMVMLTGRAVLWIVWSLLLNLALILFLRNSFHGFGLLFDERNYVWLFLALNGVLLIISQAITQPRTVLLSNKRFDFLGVHKPWVYQVQVLAVLICATGQAFVALFDWQTDAFLHGFSALAVMAFVFMYYRYKCFDIPVLALWMMAAMTIIMALIIKLLNGFNENVLLLLALVLIAMTAGCVKWLKVLHAEGQDHG